MCHSSYYLLQMWAFGKHVKNIKDIRQQRLSDLTFLYINYDKDINIDGVTDILAGKREKKIRIRKYLQD